VAANTTRHGIVLFNNGPNDLFIGFTNGVTTANGIKIFPSGSWQLMGLGIYRGAIWGICASTETADCHAQQW
jgi:hypothetical protein